MVLELMQGGDLRSFLIQKRTTSNLEDDNLYIAAMTIESGLSSRDLLDISGQVTAGMAHLSEFNVSLEHFAQ